MRQTRTITLLREKEGKLMLEVQRAATEVERLGGELRLVRELLKQVAEPPRKAKAKRGMAAPTHEPNSATTTAA